jgi:vacuolar-type H+-ATPase subunit F/Vma7
MSRCAFVGDEVSAVGFRLTGIAVYAPAPAEVAALFRTLCREQELILITAEMAQQLPTDLLQRQLRARRPLLLVIDDVRGRHPPVDLAEQLRRQLGMAE